MLSGEGNAGERWKTAIGLISKKKQLCTCSTLFLFISLPLFCTTTTWHFQKLLSRTFHGGNVERVLVHIFFFHLALVAASFSHFVTAATKFWYCSSNKKISPLFFLSRSRSLVALFLVKLRWPAAYFLFFSVFILLYIPNLWTLQWI